MVIASAYAALLTISPVIRGSGPDVRLAFSDLSAAAGAGRPVVLIHGSPGSRRVPLPLAELLAASSRVIVPDVPGFGASTGVIVAALVGVVTAAGPFLGAVGAGMLVAFERATWTLVGLGCLGGLLLRGLAIGSWSLAGVLRALCAAVAAWVAIIGLLRLGLDRSSWFQVVVAWLSLVTVTALATNWWPYRRRRLLVGRWIRWTRWEFWPPWLFYPPIVAYMLWLGLRFRSLTLFTAANPGMPGGGFVGESKSDILARVAVVPDVVPAFTLIRGGDDAATKRAAVEAHVAAHAFPVVVKPDQGQRGAGVTIARSAEALAEAVDASSVDTILQRYVPGDEFGVFYYRFPSDSMGRIFAITEKRLQVVIGDGRRTLEQLILDHPRAVAVAPFYLRWNAERLEAIPPAGERVQLSELGVHSRGAIFYDGAHAQTPELAAAIDRIGRAVDGFFFGRFDVRAESLHAFKEGRFAVIELNGVTSEATSIYDPANSVFAAYRVMFAQWRLAFEIGAANRARGVQPSRVRDLVAMTIRYRGVARGHLALRPSRSREGR